ncbi:MAG: amidohydrolase family protein [Candidatus Eisenbacteria bacterium]|uniref:Amidohydrolase family protein n=1 Tax=Eiseniibacteriota bacterium TaxID=2212470 RepID=A0A933SAS2_UNCEI|nr:amidohydrolase family protein [Candidatus Eisenbacteria bacterium]
MTQPGHVNAHTHLYSALAPYGIGAPSRAPVNFVEILEAVWWRLDRALDEKTLRAGTRAYVAEALLAGPTALVDHHESPNFIEGSLDVLADACEEFGMRAVLTYGATERNGGRAEAARGLAECARFVHGNRRPLVRGLVGLHASFTVSDATVREAGELCRALGTVMHVHVAEDTADVADAHARGFAGPYERLRDLGALPEGSLMAHGVWLSPEQVRDAHARGLWLLHNPRSNANNRVGYARSLAASPRVALGTDGFPSDLPLELQELLALAAAEGDTAGDAALRARLDAGRTLMAERFGGEAALEQDRVEMRPDAAGTPRPWRVTVAGRVVVDEGRLVGADIEQLRADAREAAPGLWRRMESDPWPR